MRRQISASVDGGPSGGSSVRKPGSEDPHRRQRKFTEVINKIEKSNLNYVIHHKTPFSAHISLKRSFVKFYNDLGDPIIGEVKPVLEEEPNKTDESSKITKALEAAKTQIFHLEFTLKEERMNVKSLTEEVGNQ